MVASIARLARVIRRLRISMQIHIFSFINVTYERWNLNKDLFQFVDILTSTLLSIFFIFFPCISKVSHLKNSTKIRISGDFEYPILT